MLHSARRATLHSLSQKIAHHESRLSRLNSECISKINRVDIDQSTKKNIEKIYHDYQFTLFEEVKYQYESLQSHKIFYPDDSPDSKELAKGHQISCGLFSTQEFLKNYSVIIPGMNLEAAIHPSHKNYLIKSFQKTLNAISDEERAMLRDALRGFLAEHWPVERAVPDQADVAAHAHADHDLCQTRQRMHVRAPQSTLEVRHNSIFVILYQPRHTEHSSLITAIRPHTTCTSSNNFAGQ